MKKIMQKRIDAQARRAEAADKLLGERKRNIGQLKEEIQGLRQTLDIMAAYLDVAVSAKGEVRIPVDEVNRCVKQGYDIEPGDGELVLRRKKC